MSGRKLAKAINKFLKRMEGRWHRLLTSSHKPPWLQVLLLAWQAVETILTESQRTVKRQWRQRGQLWLYTRRRFSRSGFLLPMVAVLLVVFSLVVGAILLQAINRTTDVVGDRNEQVIYNAATIAIDRAKAKLEYMFNEDPRWPRGLPGDQYIEYIMLNGDPNPDADEKKVKPVDFDPTADGIQDPYTLPDETRIDINGDGQVDNAWTFTLDSDGDSELLAGGEVARIAYSILSRVADDSGTVAVAYDDTGGYSNDAEKSEALVVRSGPINTSQVSKPDCIQPINSDEGWQVITGATVRRSFQTFAVVIEDKGTQRSVATLEMQQDRQADKGNKWGAWFRNDLEIFPGPDFRWNGAIHTEGNLVVGDSNNKFQSYLISAPNSCLYQRQNSEITIGGNRDETTPPFMGQLIRGSLKTNKFSGSSKFYVHVPGKPGNDDIYELDDSDHIDSVNATGGLEPIDMSLEPVALFTRNENVARNPEDATNANARDSRWKEKPLFTEGRIFNRSAKPPYIDDTYRADDRYGPKPNYTQLIGLDGNNVGDPITDADPNSVILLAPEPLTAEASGLDGYWERRSRREGMTMIVGQRLELGNTFGWEGADDPLYPPIPGYCTGTSLRCHEHRQWKSMRDNLAAVQSTVVYHNARDDQNDIIPADFPLACWASTAHPGTRRDQNQQNPGGTVGDSTRFTSSNGQINTDFFRGRGTNGWEFDLPASDNDAFADAIDADEPLRIALTNLANFAGDPFGAFPARQDTDDGDNTNDSVPVIGPVVHPYPTMSMWGDFSNLRRAIALLDDGTDYEDLSIADQATLQTAACTLGMLAYNIQNILSFKYTDDSYNQKPEIEEVFQAIRSSDISNSDEIEAIEDAGLQPTGEDYVRALYNSSNSDYRDLAPIAEAIVWKEQIMRDLRFGFYDYVSPEGNNKDDGWSSSSLSVRFDPALPDNSYVYNSEDKSDSDFYKAHSYFGYRDNQSWRIREMARRLTPAGPKFPALYYLFPMYRHDHDASTTSDPLPLGAANIQQPSSEPYIDDATDYVSTVNEDVIYRVVSPDRIDIAPKVRSNWLLPNSTSLTDRVNLIIDNTGASATTVAIGFLDKGFFNGREMMSVRGMDLDLDMLRNGDIADASGTDYKEKWLPYSGIVYAFREDAVREDAIARPSRDGASLATCGRASTITSTTCRMDAVSDDPHDPPVNSSNLISTKPVDFYADPDRRPHGFRLRNGSDLRRPEAPSDLELRGLAFITDNPAYIVGDNSAFNLHAAATNGDYIEEFDQLLNDNWGNFYDRTTLDPKFARAGDTWRPAEIIADGISLVSQNFIDGSIAEGIRERDIDNQRSSYRTLNAPSDESRSWVREDGSVSDYSNDSDYSIPIKISRNGYPLYCVDPSDSYNDVSEDLTPNSCLNNGYRLQEYGRESDVLPVGYDRNSNRGYETFTNGKDRINGRDNTRINATIVSGLVPSRAGQSYGGIHNFPRFVECWSGDDLFISGAFIQLNFSVYATGPFDQDSWEPGLNANGGSEPINYYCPPNRRWGYDVGLQYSPAGPVASRFITPSNTRSEFYREPPVDDPYICLLRKAKIPGGGGETIDPDLSSCS